MLKATTKNSDSITNFCSCLFFIFFINSKLKPSDLNLFKDSCFSGKFQFENHYQFWVSLILFIIFSYQGIIPKYQ